MEDVLQEVNAIIQEVSDVLGATNDRAACLAVLKACVDEDEFEVYVNSDMSEWPGVYANIDEAPDNLESSVGMIVNDRGRVTHFGAELLQGDKMFFSFVVHPLLIVMLDVCMQWCISE